MTSVGVKAARRLRMQADLVGLVGVASAWRWRRHLTTKAAVRPPARAALYDRLWRDAAAAVGARVEEVDGALRIARDGATVVVDGTSVAGLERAETLRLSADKAAVHRRLRDAGVPVAASLVTDRRQRDLARTFLDEHRCIVVKPAGTTGRGTGVTCGVRDDEALGLALRRASGWGDEVLLERQLVGEELRVLVLDGEVIGTVRREPPGVVGDGRRRIGDLIVDENRRRADAGGERGLWPIRIDLDCALALRAQGLSLRDVPAAGERVEVKTTTNENGAHENHTVRPTPADVAAVARTAANCIGARLVSVELVVEDVAGERRPAVIELNTTPGILYHRHVARPATADDVGARILDVLLSGGAPA